MKEVYENPMLLEFINVLGKDGLAVAQAGTLGQARTFLSRLNMALHRRHARHLISCKHENGNDDSALVIAWMKSKYRSHQMNDQIKIDVSDSTWLNLSSDYDWRNEAKFLLKDEPKEEEKLKNTVIEALKRKGLA